MAATKGTKGTKGAGRASGAAMAMAIGIGAMIALARATQGN
jgi:hypothetical protein